MPLTTIGVIGATGLIGGHLVQQLQADSDVGVIRVIGRSPATFAEKKVDVKVVNFDVLDSLKEAINGCDAVFCAVGTTQKKVKGNQKAYRKVDYDIPVNAAQSCLETGCRAFLVVSSVGADSKSKTFYLRVKGAMENAVKALPVRSMHVFRPSILLGNRDESRPAEKLGQTVAKAISFLFLGGLKKYKPIEAGDVAAAMIAEWKKDRPGFFVHEYPLNS